MWKILNKTFIGQTKIFQLLLRFYLRLKNEIHSKL
jgi:hypothetical protein